LPGTVFYEKVKAEMKSKQNWRDSDDLQIMFNSTYQAEFYRVLQRFVHYQFRLRQGLQDLHNRRLTKRSLLTAYYLARKAVLKTRLKQIEPDAGGRF
jgi:anaerobic magnesium-protoporphyrin IX monomethyl ester cyclase